MTALVAVAWGSWTLRRRRRGLASANARAVAGVVEAEVPGRSAMLLRWAMVLGLVAMLLRQGKRRHRPLLLRAAAAAPALMRAPMPLELKRSLRSSWMRRRRPRVPTTLMPIL